MLCEDMIPRLGPEGLVTPIPDPPLVRHQACTRTQPVKLAQPSHRGARQLNLLETPHGSSTTQAAQEHKLGMCRADISAGGRQDLRVFPPSLISQTSPQHREAPRRET